MRVRRAEQLFRKMPRELRLTIERAAKAASRRGVSLYLAGGCVRDLLLGAPLKDLDLVTEVDVPGLAGEIAAAIGGRARNLSRFGTCRIDGPGESRIDLAIARREGYPSPAALPVVEPAPIEEDLLRRDFTINSMAIGLSGPDKGVLLDPAGGNDDLQRRRLRLLHVRSLADDPTRAFRASRYAVRFSFRTARNFRAALTVAESDRSFERLTPARLRREMDLLWRESDPAACLLFCSRWRLLRHLHQDLRLTPGVLASIRRAADLRSGCDAAGDPEAFLALLSRALPSRKRRQFCARLRVEGAALRRVLHAASAPERLGPIVRTGPRRKYRGATARGAMTILEAPLIDLVVLLSTVTARRRRQISSLIERGVQGAPQIGGREIISLGVPAGPTVGEILRALRLARLSGEITSPEEEIEMARRLIRRYRP